MKPRDSMTCSCEVMVYWCIILCAFFSGTPCIFRESGFVVQLMLEFQGLAQECEGDSAVVSQRLKSLATELQSVVEKQLQVSAVAGPCGSRDRYIGWHIKSSPILLPTTCIHTTDVLEIPMAYLQYLRH